MAPGAMRIIACTEDPDIIETTAGMQEAYPQSDAQRTSRGTLRSQRLRTHAPDNDSSRRNSGNVFGAQRVPVTVLVAARSPATIPPSHSPI